MYDPGYIRQLSDIMFVSTLFSLVAAKGLDAAWSCRETVFFASFEGTQRKRYTFLLLAQLMTLPFSIYMLTFGPHAIWFNMNRWTHGTGPIGYVVWFGVALLFATPILGLLTLVHIYRHPSRMARRDNRDLFLGCLYHVWIFARFLRITKRYPTVLNRYNGNVYVTTDSVRLRIPMRVVVEKGFYSPTEEHAQRGIRLPYKDIIRL